jgi:hypothetical protein
VLNDSRDDRPIVPRIVSLILVRSPHLEAPKPSESMNGREARIAGIGAFRAQNARMNAARAAALASRSLTVQ